MPFVDVTNNESTKVISCSEQPQKIAYSSGSISFPTLKFCKQIEQTILNRMSYNFTYNPKACQCSFKTLFIFPNQGSAFICPKVLQQNLIILWVSLIYVQICYSWHLARMQLVVVMSAGETTTLPTYNILTSKVKLRKKTRRLTSIT